MFIRGGGKWWKAGIDIWPAATHAYIAVTTCAAILACALSSPALAQSLAPSHSHLPEPADLTTNATAAVREGKPLLVLFSESGCPWCERLRKEHLLPMQRNAGYQAKLQFLQVDVDGKNTLRDFTGQSVTQAALARRYGIRVMPTVLLLGPRGEVLAEPLIGFTSADFYGYYLDQRIDAAIAKLRAAKPG